jgi:hypothetical protein
MKIKLLTLFSFLLFGFSFAQKDHKFLDTPKLDINDLRKTKSAIKEDAPAEVLYRSIHYYVRKDYENKTMLSALSEFMNENSGKYCDLKYDGSSIAIYLDSSTGIPKRIVTVGNLNLVKRVFCSRN